jgi:hypothetical protein
MGLFINCHIQVGNSRCWRHAHCNPADLFYNNVTKSHAVVEHHKFKGFSKAADENPYMFDTSRFETTAIRMTLLGCAEETMVAAKMPAVKTEIVMEDCDSEELTSMLKPTTAYQHQQQEQRTQDVPCYCGGGDNVGGEVVAKQQQW